MNENKIKLKIQAKVSLKLTIADAYQVKFILHYAHECKIFKLYIETSFP